MSENNADGAVSNPDTGSNSDNSNQPPVSSPPNEAVDLNPAEKARRELQSQRDKSKSDLDEVKGQLDAMTPYVAKMARKEIVNSFLADSGKDYPHVTADDLEFFGVTDGDEALAVAKQLETRFKQAEQDALVKVQNTQDLGMTEQEKTEALKELETGDGFNGSKFLQSLKIRSTKVRK